MRKSMASKLFLDANVVLDFILQRNIGYTDAKVIIERILDGNFSAYVTPSIVHIAGYFLKKTHGIETTKKMLLSFLSDIRTIDIPFVVVQQAIMSAMIDVEDSLQYYSAMHHNVDYFISRDVPLKKFALPQLPVINPKDFIANFIN